MPLRDVARDARDLVRDGFLLRERLRARNRGAYIQRRVLFAGDPSRAHLAAGVSVFGPTVLNVTDGGGLTGARLEVGERTYIGEFNNIRCAGAPIVIGADCLVSQHITIVGSNHGLHPSTPIGSQPWHGEGVVVGDDVWIGAGAVLLPGARVGDGAIVAAGAVVTGEVAPGVVVGGLPARVLSTREASAVKAATSHGRAAAGWPA